MSPIVSTFVKVFSKVLGLEVCFPPQSWLVKFLHDMIIFANQWLCKVTMLIATLSFLYCGVYRKFIQYINTLFNGPSPFATGVMFFMSPMVNGVAHCFK